MWLTFLLLMARATGALFIFSGVSKLMARPMFLASLRALPFLPAWSINLVFAILPWAEIVLGVALVDGLWTTYVAWVTLAFLLAFSLVAIVAVRRGIHAPCSCFGASSRAQLSWKTVGRNALLALCLLPLLVSEHPSPFSMDALLNGSDPRVATDPLFLALFPACAFGIAVLGAVAQQTLAKISTS